MEFKFDFSELARKQNKNFRWATAYSNLPQICRIFHLPENISKSDFREIFRGDDKQTSLFEDVLKSGASAAEKIAILKLFTHNPRELEKFLTADGKKILNNLLSKTK